MPNGSKPVSRNPPQGRLCSQCKGARVVTIKSQGRTTRRFCPKCGGTGQETRPTGN